MRSTTEPIHKEPSPEAAPEPKARLRVVFIPEVDDAGTSERTPMVLRAIRDRHDVVGLRPAWDRILYDPRRPRWPRALLYVADKTVLGLRALFAARRHRADVVFCETAHHALAGLLAARVLGVRCVWDSHGNGRLFYESLGKGRTSVRLISALERFLGARVDGLITVSGTDAVAYSKMGLPRSKIHVIPLCVNLRDIDSAVGPPGDRRRDPAAPPVLLLFGSFGYEPNREALQFVNDVLAPRLEREGIRCEIWIAGRDIPTLDFHPSVRVLGFVPDIYATIRDADLCIVPVRRGVGVLTKVIDSMAVGTPVVLSEFAARGIPEVRHGVHAYVAGSDEAFARCVSLALSDGEATRLIAQRARELVERGFDWAVHVSDLDAVVRGRDPFRGGAS